jgi:RpiB/LacA/LacB family sugar-phosphate isomerase
MLGKTTSEQERKDTMRLVIGADHAGFALKEALKDYLSKQGHEVLDVGAHAYDGDDDYPDFSAAVGRAVAGGEAPRGILVCGSGVGASIAANKIAGVRACLCHDIYSATQGVEHDDMNVLCLGGLIVGEALARKLVDGFLGAEFIGEGRFRRRLEKVLALEE